MFSVIRPDNRHISIDNGEDDVVPMQGREQGRSVQGVGDAFWPAMEVCIL